MLLCLPSDKPKAYIKDINDILDSKSLQLKELESLVGKLQHAAYVIPLSTHFLERLRRRISKMRKDHGYGFIANLQRLRLNKEEIADLILWKHFIDRAKEGISLNGLTVRKPTRFCFSDSCPLGLGGFTHNGRAWRLRINPSSPIWGVDKANNALEFLGMCITIWLSLRECKDLKLVEEIILGLGDNSSAVHWIRRSSLPTKSIYYSAINFISRKLAEIVSSSGNFIVSQHISGERNVISDYLSFEGTDRSFKKKMEVDGQILLVDKISVNPVAHDKPPNDVLTQRILSDFPQLVPPGFKISHLPEEMLSFAQQAVQLLESSLIHAQRAEAKPMTDTGVDGLDSASITSTVKTPALSEYPQTKPGSIYGPSSKYTESPDLISQERLLESIGQRWREKLLEKPSGRYLRRTSTVLGKAPFTNTEIALKDCTQN